jgi:hypothetical protein
MSEPSVGLQISMGAIAGRLAARSAAPTEGHPTILVSYVLDWRKFTAFMTAITIWLICTFSTRTPEIALSRFNINHVRLHLRGFTISHIVSFNAAGESDYSDRR